MRASLNEGEKCYGKKYILKPKQTILRAIENKVEIRLSNESTKENCFNVFHANQHTEKKSKHGKQLPFGEHSHRLEWENDKKNKAKVCIGKNQLFKKQMHKRTTEIAEKLNKSSKIQTVYEQRKENCLC